MISLNTELQRFPELRIYVETNSSTRIWFKHNYYTFGHHALSVLDAFSQPRTVQGAMDYLKPRLVGRQSFEDILRTVIAMANAGILEFVDETRPRFGTEGFPFGGYDWPSIHIAILNDEYRKKSFMQGVREIVQPGDIVIDHGSGSGILGVEALKAGAKHVYAIEPTAIGKYAREVFKTNGMEDSVTVIEDWSEQTTLPERADVLLTDIVGNEPLGMEIWEVMRDCRERLLKPDARLLPQRVHISAMLVDVPDSIRSTYLFTPAMIKEWEDAYGIDFSPLLDVSHKGEYAVYVEPVEAQEFDVYSDAASVVTADFFDDSPSMVDRILEIEVAQSGSFNAVLVFYEVELGPTARFRSHPENGTSDSHWYLPVWLLQEPRSVKAGDMVRVHYEYSGEGRASVTVLEDGGTVDAGVERPDHVEAEPTMSTSPVSSL